MLYVFGLLWTFAFTVLCAVMLDGWLWWLALSANALVHFSLVLATLTDCRERCLGILYHAMAEQCDCGPEYVP